MPKAETSPDLAPRPLLPELPLRRRLGFGELAWLLAAFGVALRLEQYFYNRSLWMDEAMVGLNLIHRSFGQLTTHLDFHVVEPVAWLFVAKLCDLLFGGREMVLRLPVIAAGCWPG